MATSMEASVLRGCLPEDGTPILWFAGVTTLLSFLLGYQWLGATLNIEIIRSCCGRNADHKLGGYYSNMPDAEILAEAKERKNTITVYVAKEIVTMDPTWPKAKVVACQYGRILGIGQSIDDLDPWLKRNELDPEDVIIDRTFETRVIVPGFIEQHGHPLIGGTAMSMICVAFHDTVAPYAPMIKGCKSKKEVIDRLKAEHKKRPIKDGNSMEEALLAWGFDSVAMGCHLTKNDLDEIDPDGKRPVFVWDCSMHFAYVNTAMMEKLLKLDIKNGRKYEMPGVQLDPTTGELMGTFLGIQALQNTCKRVIIPLMKPSRSLQSMHHITEIARMGGITTMCELLMGHLNLGLEMDLYRWFFENELTPCRCVCVMDAASIKKSMSPYRFPIPNSRANAAARWIKNQQQNSSEKLIFNNGVKFFADDSFLGLTIQMAFPGYVEPQRRKGIWNSKDCPGAPFAKQILPFWKAGCRVHVHSNGDASQDAMTEVVQMLQTIHPRFDHRFCLEHYGMSAMHIHRRLKNLGVNVSVNVYYALLRGQINEAHIGKDKAHAASRLKSMVDAGLVVAMHADTPVAPPRPLEEMWFACNRMAEELIESPSTKEESMPRARLNGKSALPRRKGPKKLIPICPAERITPYQAMKMKTIDAAYIHGLDGLIGSIEAGKFADFAVLAENPLETDKATLRDIPVIATVVGGVKRMNIPQKRKVPLPPGDSMLGQVFWLKAANIVGTGILPGLRRWVLFKIALVLGSNGTVEEAKLKAKKKAASDSTKTNGNGYNHNNKKDPLGLNGIVDTDGSFCVRVEEEGDEFTPIICKHVKPTRSNFDFRGCC